MKGSVTCLCLALVFTGITPMYSSEPKPREVAPAVLQPFDLNQVRLLDGPCRQAMLADRQYLKSLDADRLLYNFRVNAGLPAPSQPVGGWEAPDCELRGHFVGHYLSACALMYRSTGDEALKAKAETIVAELSKCQQALGGGYLSAFPTSFFDRLEAGQRVWAPYYTIHKIMAGLLDVYRLCGDEQALQCAEGMAGYFKQRTDKLSDAQMSKVLRNEFGGMSEVLYNLYAATGKKEYFELAHRFDQESFLGPLTQRQDDLTGIHANTHIPKILGAARRYELTGEESYHTAVTYFWQRITADRSYATGGSNEGEYWGAPDKLAHTLAPNNEETCTTYNMLKVTRDLIRWTGDPAYADFYERAFFNGILPAQDPRTGMMIYYLPLAAGQIKRFGGPYDAFWCCYGTGVESFAKLGDSIYFHDQDGLYVNLYVASELNWTEKGVRVDQITRFPEEAGSEFVFHTSHPTLMTLHLHVPYWASNGYRVKLNGKPLALTARPTSYLEIKRPWAEGDRIEVAMPMSLHTQPMPDDPDMMALMYGPLVLAGVTQPSVRPSIFAPEDQLRSLGADYLPADPHALTSWFKPVQGQSLTFRTVGLPNAITFIPLYKVLDQPYGVYWIVSGKKSADYAKLQAAAEALRRREARVVDQVFPGRQFSERAHHLVEQDSATGPFMGARWRDAKGYFGWDLKVLPDAPMTLTCIYWGEETGPRVFDILVDGQKIATQSLDHNKPGKFFDIEYPIPAELTAHEEKITVEFKAHEGSTAGGVFGCATMKRAAR